jgi:hypothetical protein
MKPSKSHLIDDGLMKIWLQFQALQRQYLKRKLKKNCKQHHIASI